MLDSFKVQDMEKTIEPDVPEGPRPAIRLPASSMLLLLALVGFLGVTLRLNLSVHDDQQFMFLARSFLQGDLAFTDSAMTNFADTTPHNGSYFCPLGPLPAVLLMPFEFAASTLGAFFYQGYLQPFLVCALLAVVFRIARRTGYDTEDAGYLAFGFAFATAFLGVAMWPWSWYLSQVLTCLLVFLAIAEMTERRRPLVIGMLFALALATRVTAALGVLWCVGELALSRPLWRDRLRSIAVMGLPCLVVLLLLLCYNYARFDNAFEQGYAGQIIPAFSATARSMGIFSLRHLPGNLYYLLLAAPMTIQYDNLSAALKFPFVAANPWGMSIFITSPCFLYLFGLRCQDRTSRLLLLTVVLIALPILFYYGVGYRQFGYRYSLDFAPFLYYLLLRNYRLQRGPLTRGFKAMLVMSASWNLYLFAGTFLKLY